MKRLFNIFMLLALLLAGTPSLAVYAAGNTPALPISKLLNTDGTLNLTTGYSGAVDADNYSVHLDPAHGPVFSPLMTVNAWSSLGGGLNNIVYAIAINGSNVYMGGQFTDAGGNTNADRIAKWNGSSWSALGSGLPNGQVNALAFNGSVLYVGGSFTNAGGVSGANYIAQWNGSSWSTLGDGVTNTVNSIGVSGSNIYIAGNFSNAGVDINADYIAKLDGGTWAALGATPLTGPVNSIAVAGASVYAGGDFINVGGNADIDRIALWDGTSWSPLGSGLGATVVSIALSGGDVYVGGLFNDAGGNPNADKIAKWDGTAWSALGSGLSSFVNNIVISGSNISAGGNFINAGGDANADYIARWNGSNWAALGVTPLTNTVSAIAINGLDVYVGGIFNDAAGDSNGDKIALFQMDPTAPTVASFTAAPLTNSLDIPITAFTASDNIGVTGYQITQSPTPPSESTAGWTASAPTTYTVAGSGSYLLYPWVKDAMGNVSAVYGSPVSVSVDPVKPTVNSFSATSPSTSLDISITAFTASDDVAVTGYLITTSSAPPSAGIGGWTSSAPTTYTVASSGDYTLYPWAKDAAGNVSDVDSSPASVTVDAGKPTVNSFSATSLSTSLDIPITAFAASDDVEVTGYLITTSSTPPSAGVGGWAASAPTTYTVASSGSYTLYPWAKDAAGNISAVYGSPASVTVSTTAPSVTTFSTPSSSSGINISITSFTASDDVSVTGYLITESSTPPSAGAGGWTASAPTTYTVASGGSYTLYPWAKDAVGNVSAVYGSPSSIIVDAVAPTISSFTVPSSSNTLNISITAFTASDTIGVTGYLITESATPPAPGDSSWSGTAPTTYTVGADGNYTLYPWAKDAAGNVSSVYGSPASVEVDTTSPSDTTAPSVGTFTAASTSNSLNISITAFTASDDMAVTGYLITSSSTPPSASSGAWTGSTPTTYTVGGNGSYTLYPWVKDAAGNVSALYGSPASVEVNIPLLIVTNTNDNGPGSLRDTIANAASGDTITFAPALSAGTIHLTSTLTISKNLTIDGSALASKITISGDSDSNGIGDVRVFLVNSGVTATLNSLTITKGSDLFGGGIRNQGMLTITNSTLSNNSATSGGGILSTDTLTISNSTLSSNSVSSRGGGIHNQGTLTVTNSTLSNNSAALGSGGGIYNNGGILNYTNTIIANSTAGGDCVNAGTGTINTNANNLVEDGSCSAALNGDPNLGPLADNSGSTQTFALLTGSPAINAGDATTCAASPVNNLDQRGVTRPQGGQCDIGAYEYETIVTSNADSGPGTLRQAIADAVPGDTIIFDSSLSGSTIYLASTLTISKNITIDGSALASQVAISGDSNNDGTGDVQVFSISNGATVTLNSLTITKGSNSTAAGIFNESGATLTITNSTLTDNTTTGGPGGGIRNDGTLTVTNSTFSDNSAFGGSGGGIRNIGTLTVANSTFSNNTTTGSGGGIYNVSGFVSLTITNSTFSGNSAGSQGGGIYYSGGVLNYANTMIANSISGGDCAGDGTINTNTNNLVEDGSCSAALNGDPNLGPLADNGGFTQTFALLTGSPAIDAGDDSVCAAAPVNSTSQNGVTRPVGAHCDIGSFEYVDTIAPTVTSIVRAGGSTTSATSVSFLVTFSEDVTGVDSIANDFSLTTTGSVSGAAVTGISGLGSIYTITVSTGTGTGTLRLDVPISASITDLAANSLDRLPFISGPAYTIVKPPASKPPVLRSPRNSIVTNNPMPTLWWTAVRGGTTYEIVVATDNTFATIIDTDVVSGLSHTVALPLIDGNYFWRVRAYNASNQPGMWSSTRTFTIDTTGPIAPTLSSPADNAASNRTPTFKWLSVPTAVLYEFQYDNDSDFSSPYDVTTRGTFRKPPAMKPGIYYWHVRAKDASGNWGDWSTTFTITITNP